MRAVCDVRGASRSKWQCMHMRMNKGSIGQAEGRQHHHKVLRWLRGSGNAWHANKTCAAMQVHLGCNGKWYRA